MLENVEEETLIQKWVWMPTLTFWWANGIHLLRVHAFPMSSRNETVRKQALDALLFSGFILLLAGITLKLM